MSLILRFTIDEINTIAGTDTSDEMNIPDQQDTSSNPTASTTTLDVRVDPVEKITGNSEDHWSFRTDKRIREMWFHLNTASSTTYTP